MWVGEGSVAMELLAKRCVEEDVAYARMQFPD